MVHLIRIFVVSMGLLMVVQAIGARTARSETGGVVTVHCDFADGLQTSIRTPRSELPDTTVRALRAHCAVQRSLIVGGPVDLDVEVSFEVEPAVAGGIVPGVPIPECGTIHFQKVEREKCKNDLGVGTMEITYSCWNMEVLRLNGGRLECYADPDNETCVDFAWGECVVPNPPQTEN